MSRGSPIVPVRIPEELLKEMDELIRRANDHRAGEDWTRSSFITTAIREKLAKMERCRTRKPRQKGPTQGQA